MSPILLRKKELFLIAGRDETKFLIKQWRLINIEQKTETEKLPVYKSP